jgi:ZIP family zinc transporter
VSFAALIPAAMAFLSTSLGGLLALRVRDRLHLLLGFSSGAILGIVFFDILPEVADRAGEQRVDLATVLLFTAAGFFAFFALERVTKLHSAREHEHREGQKHGGELGTVSAAGLSLHSFLDGVAIAVAFQGGTALGVLVSLAVLTHDFSDGLNTVTVVLAHGSPVHWAQRWLLVDASAPVLGALVGVLTPLPQTILLFLLASFAGSFLYIGASDLLPEAREHDSPWVLVTALGGISVLYVVTHIISDVVG